jgi:hypothetical protein
MNIKVVNVKDGYPRQVGVAKVEKAQIKTAASW